MPRLLFFGGKERPLRNFGKEKNNRKKIERFLVRDGGIRFFRILRLLPYCFGYLQLINKGLKSKYQQFHDLSS